MKMRKILLAFSLPVLLHGWAIAAWAGGATVGEASFVIGVARIVGDDGATKQVGRGDVIRVGDSIETEAGGHVHVRFVDGGQISVRPGSRLKIEDYRHDAQSVAQSAIKFRLDEGVVRSITGRWGEAARERFRLNTPIAAIGIKGTDFVVKADSNTVYASVNTGAIVLAPLDASCRASLGPCNNGREQLLTADMRGKMLELTGSAGTPRLVPAVDLAPADKQSAIEGRTADKFQARVDAAVDPASKVATNETQGAMVAQANSLHPAVPPAPPGPPVVEQLVWARLYANSPEPGDTLSKTFSEARENGRQATIGNVAYTLYRPASPVGAVLNVAETSANFRLAAATAQLYRAPGMPAEAVQVGGGTLNVDFAHSTFATTLDMSNARTGNVSLAANGNVQSSGLFFSSSGNARVSGALTLDGKEAGYLFDQTLAQGALRGVTLWGR